MENDIAQFELVHDLKKDTWKIEIDLDVRDPEKAMDIHNLIMDCVNREYNSLEQEPTD